MIKTKLLEVDFLTFLNMNVLIGWVYIVETYLINLIVVYNSEPSLNQNLLNYPAQQRKACWMELARLAHALDRDKCID